MIAQPYRSLLTPLTQTPHKMLTLHQVRRILSCTISNRRFIRLLASFFLYPFKDTDRYAGLGTAVVSSHPNLCRRDGDSRLATPGSTRIGTTTPHLKSPGRQNGKTGQRSTNGSSRLLTESARSTVSETHGRCLALSSQLRTSLERGSTSSSALEDGITIGLTPISPCIGRSLRRTKPLCVMWCAVIVICQISRYR
jgi:hypothetical protein